MDINQSRMLEVKGKTIYFTYTDLKVDVGYKNELVQHYYSLTY